MEQANLYLNEIPGFSQLNTNEVMANPQFLKVKEEISGELKGMALPDAFFKQMIGKFNQLLHIDLGRILNNAWKANSFLQKHPAFQTLNQPEPVYIPLSDHQILSEHLPALQPIVNEVSLGEIKLQVYLELNLKNVVLKIQNRSIREAAIGACLGNCSIKYNDIPVWEGHDLEIVRERSLKFLQEQPAAKS
ncbi:MAG: hypothetical protein WAN36_07350 [Calditrichia bacterium]